MKPRQTESIESKADFQKSVKKPSQQPLKHNFFNHSSSIQVKQGNKRESNKDAKQRRKPTVGSQQKKEAKSSSR